jgi:hypothetical protein
VKVLRWEEFSKLPPGTIFQVGERSRLEELQVLVVVLVYDLDGEEPAPHDFYCAELLPGITSHYTLGKEGAERMGLSREGESVMHPNGYGRDGMYIHDERLFFVWEKEDRERLANWLLEPVTAIDGACATVPRASVVWPSLTRATGLGSRLPCSPRRLP